MPAFRNLIRSLVPAKILDAYRERKKDKQRKLIREQELRGEGLTFTQVFRQLQACGIKAGDAVLVHSSFSKIGFVAGGPRIIVDALLEVIGAEGNLLMPSSPNPGYQLDYIRNLKEFDVQNDPSKMGAITEYFRKLPGVIRSESPTEPVCCYGPKASWFTGGHLGELTPYTQNSPFARLAQAHGKILYIGVTLDNAGTSLHVLEDAVPDFKYPVYYPEVFHVSVKQADGTIVPVSVKVHNPEQSAKRKCDGLLPMFEVKGVMKRAVIGNAPTLVFDAAKMLEVMIDEYQKNGVTMYTPNGDNK